jgi:AcrR family transcriptional regulator
MPRSDPPPARPEGPDNSHTRARIEDALVALLAEDARVTHDAVAVRSGISRRTVYRYYPDQESLLRALRARVTHLAGPNVRYPENEAELLSTLPDIYQGFDRIAPVATVIRSTPQGRAARLADRERRVAAYAAATADAVHALPESDRRLATAMLQFLHSSAWLEMRDQWGLEGSDIARACGWAIRTLLKDLRERGARPLDAD